MQPHAHTTNRFISIDIKIQGDGQELYSTIQYKNISKSMVYIFKGRPRLWIFDDKDNEIRYTGLVYSRTPLTLNDYHAVPHNRSIEFNFEIGKSFNFTAPGAYQLRHAGGYYDPSLDITHPAPLLLLDFELTKWP